MMNAPPALDVTLRRPLRLVLLAVVLALSVAGHAHALVTVNAATFLADCVSPITVTQLVAWSMVIVGPALTP